VKPVKYAAILYPKQCINTKRAIYVIIHSQQPGNEADMIKTHTRSLKSSIHFFASIILCLVSASVHPAGQHVITDDGREVQLNDDGSWIFLTTDRFANTDDGRRIRLKDDGSWHYLKDALLKTKAKNQNDPMITLQKVVIEKYERKALKNTRVKTQTVFYLQLANASPEKTEQAGKEHDISLIEVKDNNGKNYPVLAVKTGPENTLLVRVDKSPSILDDARSMQISFQNGILGLKKPVTLNLRISDFEEMDVDGFE